MREESCLYETRVFRGGVFFILLVLRGTLILAEESRVVREDARPFHSLPLPARYRQEPTDSERFALGEFGRLTPGGRWYVTRLLQHDKTAKGYGMTTWGPTSVESLGISSRGLVAVDVKTGVTTALLPIDPADAVSALGRGCSFRIVDEESCYVWFDRSGEPTSKESRNWALDSAVYQWNFRTGGIEKRGYNWVIAEFAAAVSPSLATRIVWPQSFDPDWDGTVKLRGATPGVTIRFSLLDAEAARQDRFRSGYWHRRPRFLPASRDNEVMVFYTYSHGPGSAWLSTIFFDEAAKTRWSVRRKQLDPDQQLQVVSSYVAAGISPNHRLVPLVVRTDDADEEGQYMYVICSKDGSLVLEKRLTPWGVTSGVAASNDGGLITWAWHEGQYPSDRLQRKIAVLDVDRGIYLARRTYTLETGWDDLAVAAPVGFDAQKQVIMEHSEGLSRLASPYEGRLEQRFRLCPDASDSAR